MSSGSAAAKHALNTQPMCGGNRGQDLTSLYRHSPVRGEVPRRNRPTADTPEAHRPRPSRVRSACGWCRRCVQHQTSRCPVAAPPPHPQRRRRVDRDARVLSWSHEIGERAHLRRARGRNLPQRGGIASAWRTCAVGVCRNAASSPLIRRPDTSRFRGGHRCVQAALTFCTHLHALGLRRSLAGGLEAAKGQVRRGAASDHLTTRSYPVKTVTLSANDNPKHRKSGQQWLSV